MAKLKKFIIAFSILAVIIGSFFIWLSDKYVVPIIMYHSINVGDSSNVTIADPSIFAWQMGYLKRHGYNVISFEELVSATAQGKTLPRRSVVITFDDGYRDNYTQAFPILKKYGFPATIFPSAEQVGQDNYVTWKQIREMEKFGVAIGSHLLDQRYLPNASTKEQWRQIRKSKEILERGSGQSIDYLSYPTGGFSEQIKEIVQKTGYKGACTTNRGYDRFNKDVYELKRIRFGNKDNKTSTLWIKLSGYYNLFRKAKNPH